MADENLSLRVRSVDTDDGTTEVVLVGQAASAIPTFIVENRARVNTMTAVGAESMVRSGLVNAMQGDIGRVVEIVSITREDGNGLMDDIAITTRMETE